ncbi:Clp protease N-terminal domain-containing protein [Streptomyces anandii]|uniref:Clp protease N-terminal domain-containing protein n=1 Tax=Streptomyces anandii TaxID=285454 RepID=UPI00167BF458|nr:Clp protease N-terminal domain-containing protein [Streptomyces anandii]GGX83953.1 peptidase [Streptomyces anandii JCM 4720]
MFERFTKDARAVIEGAAGHAERAGAERVEESHVLLALFDREGSRGSFALTALGLTPARRQEVVRELDGARRRGGLSRADAEALSGLGIDLAEVVSRVEEAHGEGALAARRYGLGRHWSGRRLFSRGARDLLTQSLRVALGHRDRHIGDEHLLLALASHPGVPAEVLADHGVTYETLNRVLYGGGEARAAG